MAEVFVSFRFVAHIGKFLINEFREQLHTKDIVTFNVLYS